MTVQFNATEPLNMTVQFNTAKTLNMTGGQRDKTAQHDGAVNLAFVIPFCLLFLSF